MICSLYLSKVLQTNHKIDCTLLRNGLVTTLTFTDINIKTTIVDVHARKNSIQLGINERDWEKVSNHVYKQNQNTLHPIYIIANANGYNTIEEVKKGIEEYYPKYLNKFSDFEIYSELKLMKELIMNGELLYPNISLPDNPPIE